jgi:peptidoglycan/LPS O-acetylase OafA/YrhL
MQNVARIMWSVALVSIIYVLHRINASFDQWFAIWLLGVVASVVARRWLVPLPAALAGLALCFIAMILSRTKFLLPDTTDAMVAIGLTLALSCRTLIEWNFSSRTIDRGARFSYSLYLVHLPLVSWSAQCLSASPGGLPRSFSPTDAALQPLRLWSVLRC